MNSFITVMNAVAPLLLFTHHWSICNTYWWPNVHQALARSCLCIGWAQNQATQWHWFYINLPPNTLSFTLYVVCNHEDPIYKCQPNTAVQYPWLLPISEKILLEKQQVEDAQISYMSEDFLAGLIPRDGRSCTCCSCNPATVSFACRVSLCISRLRSNNYWVLFKHPE